MYELDVIPAIHVHQGQAVRLDRGAVGSEVPLGNPVDWARRFAAEGARWLQVVDLDAARGQGTNAELCHDLVAAVAPDTHVMFAGGIRDEAALQHAFEQGVGRALIGTAAQDSPEWCATAIARFGERIVVGLDVRDGKVLAHGWASAADSVPTAVEHLNEMGCSRIVVRCLASDGMLTGPNYELLGQICARTKAAVIASGGIAEIEDLRRLRGLVPIGVEGAVVGTAFAKGQFSLADANRVARGDRPVSPEIAEEGR